jgi:hypothetical protein
VTKRKINCHRTPMPQARWHCLDISVSYLD